MGKSIWGRTLLIAVLTAASLVLVLHAMPKAGIEAFSLTLPPGDFADRAMKVLQESVGTIDYTLGSVTSSGSVVKARMTPGEVKAIRANSVTQGGESIRNRIDQFGVREPQIVAEGGERVVVQLPGAKDQQRALELVGKTALLEVKLVGEGARVEEALEGNVPGGDRRGYR